MLTKSSLPRARESAALVAMTAATFRSTAKALLAKLLGQLFDAIGVKPTWCCTTQLR